MGAVPAVATMKPKHWSCLLFLLGHLGVIQAEEPAVFAPPQAYPAERYQAGWGKNPFTLKTVAPMAAQGSFARDLAIGSHYGASDNPTVVIVNTKTNERILLRKDQPAANGMRLNSIQLAINRNDFQVEVLLGAEAAVIKYDASYLGQLAATDAGRAATKPAAAPGGKEIRLPPPPVQGPPQVKVSYIAPPAPFVPPPATTVSNPVISLPARIRGSTPALPLPQVSR